MTQKNLMIVTSAYPYGKGESFLRAELEHISRYFDRVELVPSVLPAGGPGTGDQHVNFGYARKRWSALRAFHVARAFAASLWDYRWIDDAACVLRGPHRYQKAKELARALYRARFFQDFLENHILRQGHEFDLVYFYWMIPEALGAAAFRDKHRPNLKVVARAHGGDLYADRRAGNYIGLRGSIVSTIDNIYCVSEAGRGYLRDRYPDAADKVRLARLGVNDPGYLNLQPAGGALSIVSCSFAVEEKRLHLIVEAIAHLVVHYPGLGVKWTHVGDGPLYAQLCAVVSERLGRRAQAILKGYQTQDQIMAAYRTEQFDVFVNVSQYEGIPVSLMEACAVGIPLVATDVGGNREIVSAANGVLLAPNPDIADIAFALLTFADRKRARAFREGSRAEWERNYNAALNHDAFGRQLARTPDPALAQGGAPYRPVQPGSASS